MNCYVHLTPPNQAVRKGGHPFMFHGPPPGARFQYAKITPPKNIADVPRYLGELLGGFFKRMAPKVFEKGMTDAPEGGRTFRVTGR